MSPRSRGAGGPVPSDVYYRLNEFLITLPSLKERDDILDLANGFLVEASMEFGRGCREISKRQAEVLLRYAWPGTCANSGTSFEGVLLASDVIQRINLFVGSRRCVPDDCTPGRASDGPTPL